MRISARVSRRLVFVTTLVLMIGGALLPSRSVSSSKVACVLYEKEITYYNDAAHSQVVGTGHIYCNGQGTLDGTSSPYRTEEIVNVCCRDTYGCVPC
jgi:hypothetical protein